MIRSIFMMMCILMISVNCSYAKGKYKHQKKVIHVVSYAYTLSKRETDKHPEKNATGTRSIPGRTCAVSRDMKDLIGNHIYIRSLDRTCYVNDLMNKRYRRSIDITMKTRKKAFEFGKNNDTIVILN